MPDDACFTPAAPTPHPTPARIRRTGMTYSAAMTLLRATMLVAAGGLLAPVQADAPCKTIQFERGASSATISGNIGPEEIQCFRFTSGQGQRVRMSVESANDNTIFTIVDIADARKEYSFRSQKKTYEFIIAQLFRSVTDDHYKLTLSIR